MLGRVLWPLALLAVVVAAVGLRLLAAPSGDSIRAAVAPAPRGSAYQASGSELLLLDASGARHRVGPLPTSSPLALAAGSKLVLGAADGVFTSDNGAVWSRASVPGRHFLSVAASGDRLAAASWAGGLWLSDDAGTSWRRSPLPAGDLEVSSISLGQPDLLATLLGLLESSDRGRTWTRVPGLPGRMTAVDRNGPDLVAGAWRGQTYRSQGAGWEPLDSRRAGIWAVSASAGAEATTDGLYQHGVRILAGREVTALIVSGTTLFAFEAGGKVSILKA